MKGYRIHKKIIDEIESVAENNNNSRSTVDDEIDILKYVRRNDKDDIPILDGEKMIEDWFPKKKDKQVFISHSHEDEKTAKKLSRYLAQKNYDCFIDSEVWGSCNNLIKKINDKYNVTDNDYYGKKLYSYEGTLKVESGIYLMLTTAINKVISTCPIFIFIESENSIQESITYSPWIMEELNTYELLRRKYCTLCDSRDHIKKYHTPNVEISYKVDSILSNMEEIKNQNDINTFFKNILIN